MILNDDDNDEDGNYEDADDDADDAEDDDLEAGNEDHCKEVAREDVLCVLHARQNLSAS